MSLYYYQCTKSNLILYSSYVSALPTIYHVDENSQVAEPIMIPVASTVIPLVLFKPIIFDRRISLLPNSRSTIALDTLVRGLAPS